MVLVIVTDHKYNAISLRPHTPNWDSLNKEYPNTLINASESHVGLPPGQMGNSEVGHHKHWLQVRVIHQDIERINLSINNKEFFSLIPYLIKTFQLIE